MIGQLNGTASPRYSTADTPPKSRASNGKLPAEIDLEQVCTTIAQDYRDLEPFRRFRTDVARQIGGKHYGEGSQHEVLVNLLGMFVKIMSQSAVANNPRIMASTFDRKQEYAVNTYQDWANEEIVAMDAVETYKRAFEDSLVVVGIVKIGLSDPADAAESGWGMQAGQPFMELIDLDDWCGDLSAQRFDRMQYTSHRYRISVRLANALLAKGRKEFQADESGDYNYGGDEKVTSITRSGGYRKEIEDHCTLWEVWLPAHGLIVTLRDEGGVPDWTRGPVRVQRWIGPSCGPYHYLYHDLVPGNLMPKSPCMDLYDLHMHYNVAYRKLARETRDYKKNQAYRGGTSDEATRFKNAVDGEMVQSDSPESIKDVESGGPSNAVLIMSDHMKASYEFVGGNMALLGGRSPQSRTASQDKMLNENAGAGVSGLSEALTAFVQETMDHRGMAWFHWNHPLKVMQSEWKAPSMPDFRITRQLHPWTAKGQLPEVMRLGKMPKIRVDPYSLPRQTPQSRLAFINQVLQTVAPMMQLAQQQGVMVDMNALLDIFARYGDEPDLAKIFHYSEPPAPNSNSTGGQNEAPGMAPNTTRTYNRISTAGQGPQEKAADLTAKMGSLAGPVNPNQGT